MAELAHLPKGLQTSSIIGISDDEVEELLKTTS
jgi:hypothetical protein